MNENEIINKTREMLLGRLGDEERSSFEASFVADETMFDIVRAAEDELVEQYAFNKMSDSDRTAFESIYLKLESGRRRLALTRSLIERSKFAAPIDAERKPSIFAWAVSFFTAQRAAVGFAAIALVVGGIWIASRKPDEIAVQPTTPTPTPIAKTPEVFVPAPTPDLAELPKNSETKPEIQPTPKPERVAVPMVALIAGSLRDGGKMQQLSITDQTKKAAFRLKLDSNDYRAYRAEIVDADGRSIVRLSSLRASGSNVAFVIPTSKLKTGEFIVKLYGLNPSGQSESVADYPVRIIGKK